jgi:hypothetical protein
MRSKHEGSFSYPKNAKSEAHILAIISNIQDLVNVSKIKFYWIFYVQYSDWEHMLCLYFTCSWTPMYPNPWFAPSQSYLIQYCQEITYPRVLSPERPRLVSTLPVSGLQGARVRPPRRPRLASALPALCLQNARVLPAVNNFVAWTQSSEHNRKNELRICILVVYREITVPR